MAHRLTIIFLNSSFLLLILFYSKTRLSGLDGGGGNRSPSRLLGDISGDGCESLHDYEDYTAKCTYVKSHPGCRHKGYINYLEIFYCTCGTLPFIGHVALFLWLVVLFYLLGNTAASYFCPSLENLSKIMKLSPTIAGVTLLSLGNGAPDVFASIISFTRTGNGDVGLNSVLGGAFFVSSVVVGVISMGMGKRDFTVDKPSFIRDVVFFLFALSCLLLILSLKKITLWGAICFVSIYFIYVLTVSVMHWGMKPTKQMSGLSKGAESDDEVSGFEEMGINIPLLGHVDDRKELTDNVNILPRFDHISTRAFLMKILEILELPLQLPRRLTIPLVSEDTWSKPCAVMSVTLAPMLLAALCNSQRDNVGFKSSTITYLSAGLIGLVLGNIAFATTKSTAPPTKCLTLWLSAGFLMSVTWTYIIAEELVSLLISVGFIVGISPSVLGLTVLAWGNSLGDLIANVAMALNGGSDGAQIAISGCYAGPMFNTVIGLGLSLVFESWSKYPEPYEIPGDSSLYETIAFFMSGLLWALVIVPRKNMKLDRFLGIGLLTIYLCFLSLRLAKTMGLNV